jgi:nitrogen fixation protein NifU and related proteins
MAYDMYQEIILQHYRAPRNFGTLPEATRTGEESNPLCGDHIRFDLKIDSSTMMVDDVKFSGDGCAISVASASLLTQRVKGKPIAEVEALTREDVFKLIGIPLSPVRVKCALTGFVALGRALHGDDLSAAARSPTPAPSASGASPA